MAGTHHARAAEQNRAKVLTAARASFLEQGYDRTILTQIADQAEVSAGTLFKPPAKGELLAAVVGEAWNPAASYRPLQIEDPQGGLRQIGRQGDHRPQSGLAADDHAGHGILRDPR
jgi:TetR/AcrR family transcriptional regulator of autoinduction and epiphytic fitness